MASVNKGSHSCIAEKKNIFLFATKSEKKHCIGNYKCVAEPSGSPPGPAHASQRRHPSLQRSNRRVCCLRDVICNEGVPFRPHRGVLWVHSAFFVSGDLDLWPLTLTFKLVRAKGQARLPCEFGANAFRGSCHPLSNASLKNRTRFDDFAHLAHKWSSNHQRKLRS